MNTVGLFLLCGISIALARNIVSYDLGRAPEYFNDFTKTYNKQYDTEDEAAKRYQIFVKNLEKINNQNKESDHAVFAVNQFSDLTTEEFLKQHTGYLPGNDQGDCLVGLPSNQTRFGRKSAPNEFDWRSKGVVTEVKNQGSCGSCWAFSVIGNIESVYAIKNKKTVLLSEQELVDCDDSDYGCNGGYPFKAFAFLVKKGVMSESDYPYHPARGECKYKANSANVKISSCSSIKVKEDQLTESLYSTAPLSIALDAMPILNYKSGVVTGNACTGQNVNHAVLLVGYGTEKGVAYWLIKNSWGKKWGDNGYFKIQRGVNCVLVMNEPALTAVI